MSHPYQKACDCKRCIKEQARRDMQVASDPRNKPKRINKPRHASKEEQYGRYLDCGPAAWDDI